MMPDHLHLVWMGLRRESDQLNAMKFLRAHLESALGRSRRWQHQPHDRVLREPQRQRNAFARACFYVPGQSSARQARRARAGLALLRRGGAGLSHVAPAGRGFLGTLLEALHPRAESRATAAAPAPALPAIVAADVRRRILGLLTDPPPHVGGYRQSRRRKIRGFFVIALPIFLFME